MAEGFLSRWARLKRERDSPEGEPPAAVPAGMPADPRPATPDPAVAEQPGEAAQDPLVATVQPGGAEAASAQRELPPIDSLTPDSDFTPFLQRSVAPATRNAALKKLFADPTFNVMDGLDVYIEDYNQTTPIPDSLLRRLAQSRAVGLFDEPAEESGAGRPAADGARQGISATASPMPAAPAEPEQLEPGPEKVARTQEQGRANAEGADPPVA